MTLAVHTGRNSSDGAGCQEEDEEHRSWQQMVQKPLKWSDHLGWRPVSLVESSEERDRETGMTGVVRRDPDRRQYICR